MKRPVELRPAETGVQYFEPPRPAEMTSPPRRVSATRKQNPDKAAEQAAALIKQLSHPSVQTALENMANVMGESADSIYEAVIEAARRRGDERLSSGDTEGAIAAYQEALSRNNALLDLLIINAEPSDDKTKKVAFYDQRSLHINELLQNALDRQNNKSIDESNSTSYVDNAMEPAAAFAAAARTFSDRELQEYVQKGEVAAAVLREREAKSCAEANPRAELAASDKQSISAAARELFGDVSPTFQTRRYGRSEFPAEALNNRALVREAQRIVNARTTRTKKGAVLSDAEVEQARIAARFVKQAQRRRATKGARPPP